MNRTLADTQEQPPTREELMARIETLESTVAALEQKNNILKRALKAVCKK